MAAIPCAVIALCSLGQVEHYPETVHHRVESALSSSRGSRQDAVNEIASGLKQPEVNREAERLRKRLNRLPASTRERAERLYADELKRTGAAWRAVTVPPVVMRHWENGLLRRAVEDAQRGK